MQDNKSLIRRWFEEVWNQKREAAIDELAAPDVIVYGLGPQNPPPRGREPFITFWRQFRGAFPDIRITVEDVIAERDLTCARISFTGTHHSTHNVLNNPQPLRGDIPIVVGGSGERKTLRLVAKYADGCNIFGDVEHVKHLLGVLEGHCEDVGRDPSEITKTRMGVLFIGDSDEETQRKMDAVGLDERRRAMAFVGGPERIREQIQELLDVGIEGVTISIPDVHDLDVVRAAGETIGPVVGTPAAH